MSQNFKESFKNFYFLLEGSKKPFNFTGGILMEKILKTIPYPSEQEKLLKIADRDTVFAWLLLKSNFNQNEHWNYIYKRDVVISRIAEDLGRSRQWAAKKLKRLIGEGIVEDMGDHYRLPHTNKYQKLDGETVLNLLKIYDIFQNPEEVINLFVYLVDQWEKCKKTNEQSFLITPKWLLQYFGKPTNHSSQYNHMKGMLTLLQGAGIVKFRTTICVSRGLQYKALEVYEVFNHATQDWLDKQVARRQKLKEQNIPVIVIQEETK